MKRFLCLLSVCLLCICAVAPVKAFAYDLPNGLDTDDVVTFGVYDHETGALVQSDPIEMGDYFLTGLAHSLYESQYDSLFQSNITENDVYVYLQSQDSLQPFIYASINGWLFDVFQNTTPSSRYMLCGVRIPSTNGHPSLEFGDGDVSGTYSWEFLPSGSSYFLLNSSNNLAYAVIGGSYPYRNYTQNAVTLRSELASSGVTPSSLQDPSVSICYFCFYFSVSGGQLNFNFRVNGSLGSNFDNFCGSIDPNSQYYVSYGAGGVISKSSSYYYFEPLEKPILCVFPLFYSEHVLADSDYGVHLDLPPTDVFYPTSSSTNIYLSSYQTITPDPTLAPGVSPTPPVWITPTPYPTFVPPTPSPGAPVENYYDSIGSLMTLLTRHYNFVISGYTIAFSPFYVFMACAIMGLVVRVFFGGSHE